MKERNSDGSEDEEEDNLLGTSREESTGGTGIEGGERQEVAQEAKMSDLWDPRKPYLRNLLIMTLTW